MDPIQQGAELFRQGELVAFPTETVYGLGADATNRSAVRKIFAAKGRPNTNPLIVHIADRIIARRYAAKWDERAEKLAKRFWPGPLTLVLPKSTEIVEEVTAGLSSVGLRVPDHPVALELLRAFGGAVAAPSANRSNRISPTLAEHVREEFADAIPLIIDGGPCRVGIESTVLDLTGLARILRPGAITRQMIEEVIGEPVEEEMMVKSEAHAALSPGQMVVHYAPLHPTYRFEPAQRDEVQQWIGEKIGIVVLTMETDDPEKYARELYARLRQADTHAQIILVEMPPDQPTWTAVRDRLLRATRPWRLSDMPA
jgi:L-threonylcarbamoyladenylate synthase